MSDGLNFILCFENEATSEAMGRWLRDKGVCASQITVSSRDAGLEQCSTKAITEPGCVVLTDFHAQLDAHLVPGSGADRPYVLSSSCRDRFIPFVWDDQASYLSMFENAVDRNRKEWRGHARFSLPISLRCPSRIVNAFWLHSGNHSQELSEFVATIERLTKEGLHSACGHSCLVADDHSTPEDYLNWDILVLDDQVLDEGISATEDKLLRDNYKLGTQGTKFYEAVMALRNEFPGYWHMGGTEAACSLLCLDKSHPIYGQRPAQIPRLRDPAYGFDNYDFILLDVLFDLRIATDIHFVPKAARLSKTPVFMFSSAGTEGTHHESALYYANRALRLGAVGFLDKSEVTNRLLQTVNTISLTTGWNEWKREWEERFKHSADVFLGDKDRRLVDWLDKSARKEAEERVASGEIDKAKEEDEYKEVLKRFKYLLRKLFEDCDQVLFDGSPDVGAGAGTKFFVIPTRNGRRDNAKFVKIGAYADLRFEEANYADCIAGYLDTFTGQISRPLARAGRYAAVVYSSVGYSADSTGKPKDLRNLIDLVRDSLEQDNPKGHIQRVMEELDHAFFSRLYRERAVIPNSQKAWEPRLESQNSAERFIHGTCGIHRGFEDQWWRREYMDLLPPITQYCIGGALREVTSVPVDERTESATGCRLSGETGYFSGRLDEKKWEIKGNDLKVTLKLIDPFRHQRFSVEFAGEDQSKKLLLRRGKWLKVPCDGAPVESLDLCSGLSKRLKEALANFVPKRNDGEADGRTVNETYRPLLESLTAPGINEVGDADVLNSVQKTLLRTLTATNTEDIGSAEDLNSLEVLQKLCGAMGYLDGHGRTVFAKVPMTVTTIHGDLNLGNIMVGSAGDKTQSRNYWLIDFEKTHLYGHLARDFAKMESDIRHHVLAKALLDMMLLGYLGSEGDAGERARHELKAALALQRAVEVSLWNGSNLLGVPEPLATAYEWIAGLRQLATTRYGVALDELKVSVFLHNMSYIKYKKGYNDPSAEPFGFFPRLVHYITADALSDDILEIIKTAGKKGGE